MLGVFPKIKHCRCQHRRRCQKKRKFHNRFSFQIRQKSSQNGGGAPRHSRNHCQSLENSNEKYIHKINQFIESEAKWRTLAEIQIDYLALLDKCFIIQYVNRPFPDLNLEDVVSKSYLNFIHAEEHDLTINILNTDLETGDATSFESYYNIYPFDPTRTDFRYFDAYICPIYTNGVIDGLALCFKDITNRKEAELSLIQSEEKYRTLLDNINHGIFRTTPSGQIIHTNEALARMSGFDSFKEMEKISVESLIPSHIGII